MNLVSLLHASGQEVNGISVSCFHFVNGGNKSASMNLLESSEKELPTSVLILSHQLHAGAAERHSIRQLYRKAFAGRIGNKMETGSGQPWASHIPN